MAIQVEVGMQPPPRLSNYTTSSRSTVRKSGNLFAMARVLVAVKKNASNVSSRAALRIPGVDIRPRKDALRANARRVQG